MGKTHYIEDGGRLEKQAAVEGKKNVFLIGDSLRMGYCAGVREQLSDVANVFYPEENCRCSQYIIISLYFWSSLCDREKVDLIHFNCGHWDAAHWNGEDISLNSPEVYGENIRRIVWQMRKVFPNAKICFATTTPMSPSGVQGINPRTTQEIQALNQSALAVLKDLDVDIDDLFALMEDWDESLYADYAHPTQEGFAKLSDAVADFLRKRL